MSCKHEFIKEHNLSPHFSLQRMRKVVMVSLTFCLALVALVLVTGLQPSTLAQPARTALTSTSLVTQTYAIVATGPHVSVTPMAAFLTGDNNNNTQVLNGGIYVGDNAFIWDIFVNGNPPPPINVVGGCFYCYYSGNAVANFSAPSLTIPILYDIADFEPGGVYAIEAGSNYHSFISSHTFTGALASGLYYISGNVILQDITGTASMVATGDIRLSGDLTLTSYDPRFPLLFTTSSNTNLGGAINSIGPTIDFTGDLYAPNGLIIFSATGSLRGRVYARVVESVASNMTITCSICDVPVPLLSLQKSVMPTVNVPYGGVLTYTVVLRNRDVESDPGVFVTDTLPTGVTFGQWIEQPASGLIQSGDNITWTGTISAATGITLTFTVTSTGNYGDVITNTAYFSGATSTGSASAIFAVAPISHMLTVGYAGNGSGQVILNPPSPSYAAGTVVTLTAVPSVTSQFSGWSGDVITTTNPLRVTMDNDKFIIATFTTHRVYLPLIRK